MPIDQPGKKSHDGIADQLGPGAAVHAEQSVKNEQHGDIDDQPAHDDQDGGLLSLSQSLKELDLNDTQKHHDGRQGAHP